MPRLCLEALRQQILASPSLCPGHWSQLCLVGWTGVKGQCCISPARPGNSCCAPAVSRAPELLCRGRRGLCALQDVSLAGQGTAVLGQGSVHTWSHHSPWGAMGSQGLPRAQQAEAPSWQKQRCAHAVPTAQGTGGFAPDPGRIWHCLSPPKLGWPCRVSTVGQPRARSLFAASAAHVTRVSHVPCPLSCRHPSAGRAPHGQHGGHCLQQALSDQ